MFRLILVAFAGVLCFGHILAQETKDLNGKWQSGEGEVTFTQNGSSVVAKLSKSSCPYGGDRDFYLQGTLSDGTMTGTIMLCTHNQRLREDCHLSDPYTAKFVATVTAQGIEGTYKPDYINYDTKDGHYVNCRVTPSGGSDRSFDLTREDCCELVQKLQQQVQELTTRLQALEKRLNSPNVSLGSGNSTIQVGPGGIILNSDSDITIKSTKNVVIKGANVTRN